MLHVQAAWGQELFRTAESSLDEKQRGLVEKIRTRPELKTLSFIQFDDVQSIKDQAALSFNLGSNGILRVHRSNAFMGYSDKFTWRGVSPSFGATVLLHVSNQNVTGIIQTLDFHYAIEPLGNGLHALMEIDASKFLQELEPLEEKTRTPQEPPAKSSTGRYTVQSVPEIDVLVAYTTSAKNAHADIEALISTAESYTNASFSSSGVSASINVVHKVEVSYTEGGDFTDYIGHLSSPSDGQLDNLHTLRDNWGADLVVLIVSSGDACGIAWLNSTSSSGFSVTRSNCIHGYTFGHEIGHNLGAHHDRDVASNSYYTYGHGYKYSPGEWRTIMAYASSVNPETRINYWSNPGINYSGVPMGTATYEDNARVWDERASTVAAFKTPPPVEDPPSVYLSGSYPVHLSEYDTHMFTAVASDGTPTLSYQWYFRHQTDLYWTATGSNSPYYNHTVGPPDAEFVRIVVTDGASRTDEDEAQIIIIGLGKIATSADNEEHLPNSLILEQNYPNPFNPSTVIAFSLPEASEVSLQIFDVMGRQVADLSKGTLSHGRHEFTFNASGLASGVYISRLKATGASGRTTQREMKMQLVK